MTSQLERQQRRRKMANEMRELYEREGYCQREIADKYGYSRSYVCRLLLEVGTMTRDCGGMKLRKRK